MKKSITFLMFSVPFLMMAQSAPPIPEPPALEPTPELPKVPHPADIERSQSDVVYTQVDQRPAHTDCKDLKGDEREQCTNNAMVTFIAKNTKYPDDAQKAGAAGTVYATFVVDKKGMVTDAKILRGVHSSLDAEVLRVLKSMPRFIPGMNDGVAVNVQYTLPVKFKVPKKK